MNKPKKVINFVIILEDLVYFEYFHKPNMYLIVRRKLLRIIRKLTYEI